MKTCYIMVGVSGSGKSTVVKGLQQQHAGADVQVFSLDTCRLDFYDRQTLDPVAEYNAAFKHAMDNQQQFDQYVNGAWDRCLKTAAVLIVDNTNLTVKSRARWIQQARAAGFVIVGMQMLVPLHTVLARQATRGDKRIPEQVVRDMYFRQQEILEGSEVSWLVHVDGTAETFKGFISL